MDKLTRYRTLIRKFFKEYADLLTAPPKPELDVVMALDDEQGQYLLLKVGWKDNRHVRHTILHVAIRNGKIWIDTDMTEDGVATYFLEQGVSTDDIVLGFHPPKMRPFTEFAVG